MKRLPFLLAVVLLAFSISPGCSHHSIGPAIPDTGGPYEPASVDVSVSPTTCLWGFYEVFVDIESKEAFFSHTKMRSEMQRWTRNGPVRPESSRDLLRNLWQEQSGVISLPLPGNLSGSNSRKEREKLQN